MITRDNLRNVLSELGFEKSMNSSIYTRKYSSCSIRVDFDSERIIYPEDYGLVVNDKTTSNFSHNENFVVLECILAKHLT